MSLPTPIELQALLILFVTVALFWISLLTDWRPVYAWINKTWCGLRYGHFADTWCASQDRINFRCHCGYVSPGFQIGTGTIISFQERPKPKLTPRQTLAKQRTHAKFGTAKVVPFGGDQQVH